MKLISWCALGLAGTALSEVSVDLPIDCQAGDEACSEESALLQYSKHQHQCKPIEHSCRHHQQQQQQQQWAAKGSKQPETQGRATGFLYTATNGEGENKVVAFDLHKDGSLGRQRVYPTGSNGGSDKSRSGGLQGDYDAQGGMQIIGDKLLVVNGGGNTVSTFLMCMDGSLQHIGNVPSGGARPTSIAYFPKSGKGKGTKEQTEGKGTKLLESSDEYWVVVGNQWGNPVILGNGTGLQFYPNESYHLDGGHEKINPDLNIFLFSFDAVSGVLTPEHVIEAYPGTNGGPATVAFNEDGTKLGLTTWGIAHDGTAEQIQKLQYQRPSRFYVYDFNDGTFSNKRFYESCGDAGMVGFSWRKDRALVTVFNAVNAHGLKVMKDTGSRVTLEQEFVGDMESCWTHFPQADPSTLYVANFLANTISQFEVDAEGVVTKSVGNVDRQNLQPPGDTKEMWTDSAGKNFYVQGTGFSFTIAWYSIGEGGKLSLNKEVKVEDLIGAANYSSNLLGIAAFEYCPEQ